MRHRAKVQHFGRAQGPRKALLRGLVRSLVVHGRIKTTLAKAKELRRHVERAVTLGRRGGLHARRILLSRYPNHDTVEGILNSLVPRMEGRPGGYTRILKLGPRPGDCAEMAFIEFVDYQPQAAAAAAIPETKVKKSTKGAKTKAKADAGASAEKKAQLVARRERVRTASRKRKGIRKIQAVSRQEARA